MSETGQPHSPAAEGSAVTFTFDGRTIPARTGQSLAAALYAAGVRIFTRSFKYHRPRGLFCCSGDCPNCLLQVDGRPNVRTCVEPVRGGEVVQPQHAWPALGFDFLRIFDKLDRFLPVGFYYKKFHKPRWVWPIFERVVRRLAGLGRVDVHAAPHVETEVEHLHADVCIIGGGPAGLAAASEAAAAGASVLLLERLPSLGGHLQWRYPHRNDWQQRLEAADTHRENAPSVLDALVHPGVHALCNTTAFGLYEGLLVAAAHGTRLLKVRARQVIVSTGGRQQPFTFHNNDLPGIFLGDGLLRLARLHGVVARSRAVVLTDNDDGAHTAEQLSELGIEIAALVDLRGAASSRSGKWRTLAGHAVVMAHGDTSLNAVRVAPRGADGRVEESAGEDISCDLLCLVSRLAPANELLLQGGMKFSRQNERWTPDRTVAGLLAAGAAAGTWGLEAQLLEGRLRGAEAGVCAVAACRGTEAGDAAEHPRVQALRSIHAAASKVDTSRQEVGVTPSSYQASPGHKRFICLCEDVTEKDLNQAVAEGFDGIETLKRYSTVNMGPCQGKMCGQAAIEVCARAVGKTAAQVGATTSRPPVVPVEMCVLAADRHDHPVRRTPMHHWHQAHGAHWLDAGLWKRPERYGDPAGEVRAVRQAVGLIDVSTLGKIEVVGPDAAELLERVYLNRWSNLKPGRVRYGAMCNEEGILFDDGVALRLGPERFYLTATTGNADAVFQWLELWTTVWNLRAVAINHTSALAAMNLAGPRAREVLQRVSSIDLATSAFPYMAFREGDVAGVPCRLMRIGFVGELGYEIHCPSALALHVWESLAEAGADFGLRPFGVEAQRILRLEKGHLIVGQDSDALSNPLDAGLDWMIRWEKPLFHGREPLLRLKNMAPRPRLVGFTMADKSVVPSEGCQVVEQGRPAGRVASSRFSPTLDCSLGLAWVPAAKAAPGERFMIRYQGIDVPATVAEIPFYDSDGGRMKA